MDSILVTGASGFIGSYLVDEALRRGFQVWAGIRPTSNRSYLKDSRIRLVELDLSHPGKLRQQLLRHRTEHGRWDYVIHCAGVTKCRHLGEFRHGNYDCTRHLADALCALDMVPHKFIYLSSLNIFGPLHEKDGRSFADTDTPSPITAYGRSKWEAEQYLRSLPDFPLVVFRPTGVYGPREKDYLLMMKTLCRHLDVSVGRQPQALTFIYVSDLVEAVFLGIGKATAGTAYIVSDGQTYSPACFSHYIRQACGIRWVIPFACPLALLKALSWLSETIARLLGKTSTLNRDKYFIMKQRNWRCDITPLLQLGFVPRHLLQQGVQETVEWYRKEGWL